MNDDYLTDYAPVLITGVTGAQGNYSGSGQYGGKTALATWWADEPGREFDLVLFGNFKHDDIADVATGFVEVGSADGIADAMAAGERRIVLSPTDPDWAAVSERLCEFVRELPPALSKLVVLDEGPKLSEDAILTFVRVLGNGANCKTLLLSQSAGDFPTNLVGNMLLVWVGPMKDDYEAWFRTHRRQAAFDFIAAEHGPYEWTVIFGRDDGDWHHYDPVPGRYGEI